MYTGLHVKYPLFLSIFVKIGFSRQFFERHSNSNFMKTRPLGSEWIYTDRRRDWHDETNSCFSQFRERT